jgi:hypothetical protein
MELEEIGKILIAVVVLLVLVFAFMFLFNEKGGEILEGIKNLLRFGD